MLSLFLKKPLALACTAFLAVLFVLVLHPFSSTPFIAHLLLSLLFTGVISFLFIKRNSFRRTLFVLLLLVTALSLAFSIAGSLNNKKQSLYQKYHEKEAYGRFLVTDVRDYDTLSEFEGVFLVIDDKEVNINGSLITFNRSLSPRAGDLVEGSFTLETTEGNTFLNKQEMASGKLLQGETTYLEIVTENIKTPAVLLSSIRASVSGVFDEYLSEDGAAMAKALLLADKSPGSQGNRADQNHRQDAPPPVKKMV